jgi:YesN/AraC family two-component response regulator
MKLIIQNMVSQRCKMLVKSELDKLNIPYSSIELGEVTLTRSLPANKKAILQAALHTSGLEILEEQNAIIVEKIKNIIVEMIHYSDEPPVKNFSVYLSEKLNLDYHKLSELFSKTKGITIEHYIINHKVEKIKELIMYDELNISEISYKMHYSSVAHLSNQFKKITGLTPSYFKKLSMQKRELIETL